MLMGKATKLIPIFSRCKLLTSCEVYKYTSSPLFMPFKRKSSDHFSWKDYHMARVGNRETVGYGTNGQPCYMDRADFPFPSIRYKEPFPAIQAMREKERGDWRLLSIQEKKELYRASFCQTFAEFQAPTGEWMSIVGITLFFLSLGVWMFIFMKVFVYKEFPESYSTERQRAQLRRIIDLKTNPITGIASEWDYEKIDWKKKGYFTPDNPFRDSCGKLLVLE